MSTTILSRHVTHQITAAGPVLILAKPPVTGYRWYVTNLMVHASGATVVSLTANGKDIVAPIAFAAADTKGWAFPADHPACASAQDVPLLIGQTGAVTVDVTIDVVAGQ